MTSPHKMLLLCGHGSPRPSWRQALDRLHATMKQHDGLRMRYTGGVTCAFLEHDEPALVDRVLSAISDGFTVDVLPIFLSPGRHQREDLPRLLGITPHSRPGEETVPESAAVRLLPAPDWSSLLAQSLLRRARERLPSPSNAALFLVHYGSTLKPCPWTPLAERLGASLLSQEFNAMAHGGAGHHLPDPASSIATDLRNLLQRHESVAIVPLLLARGSIQAVTIPAAIAQLEPGEQARIGWIPDAILPDEDVHQAIADHALRKESGA